MPSPFPDFSAVEEYLNSLINYEQTFPLGGDRARPKLEPSLRAAERLDLPIRLPGCVHVAGTKGKGSVVHMLEALLATSGAVLSFSSPHLESVKERVRLNGKMLDDDVWMNGFSEINDSMHRDSAIRLTYFESVWIFYLWCAKRLKPDYHIVETGLGGTWDATNILAESVGLLTLVDYDHTEILGETLTEIAGEKAGIIKPHSKVVMARQSDEALRVFERAIAERNCRGFLAGRDFQLDSAALNENIQSAHQRENAAAAICAARILAPELTVSEITVALTDLVIPGRQQLLLGSPPVMLDVAHNPISFKALADTLREQYSGEKIRMIWGMMKEKNAAGSLESLQGVIEEVGCVPVANPRSTLAVELKEIARQQGMKARNFTSVEEGFRWLHSGGCDLGVVAGSFYLAGDYLKWRRDAGIA